VLLWYWPVTFADIADEMGQYHVAIGMFSLFGKRNDVVITGTHGVGMPQCQRDRGKA
jgi:hypothetical protein